MGLNKGIIVVAKSLDAGTSNFIVMWNDDYHIDEAYEGYYDPRTHTIYITWHMFHGRKRWDPWDENDRYYHILRLFRRRGRAPPIERCYSNVWSYDGYIVLGSEEAHKERILTTVYASCEPVSNMLYNHSFYRCYNGVCATVVSFDHFIDKLYGKWLYDGVLLPIYYLMARVPRPYGISAIFIEEENGMIHRVYTSLPLNGKYVDPPKYLAVMNPENEYCYIEEDKIVCHDRVNEVSAPKKLIGGYETRTAREYGYINMWVRRWVKGLAGYEKAIKALTLSPLLYHLTYGYIW